MAPQAATSASGRCTWAPLPSRSDFTVTWPWASSSAPKIRAWRAPLASAFLSCDFMPARPSAPAVGFGLGIERLLLLIQELALPVPDASPDAYAVVPPGTPLPAVMATLESLRAQGVRVLQHAAGAEGLAGMKSQFKKADASGARYALIFGADELAQGQVTVKALRDGTGAQVQRPLADVAAWAATLRLQSHA